MNRTDAAIAAMPAEPAPVAETPAPAAADGGAAPAPDVEEFIVLAPPGGEIMAASRMEADELINTLSADDFAKFSASDVADALKFVPGVNVVEGQFAIIRGLEDRYNSTLYNSAPVPSPDPDSQSVQLDLFPSDVVIEPGRRRRPSRRTCRATRRAARSTSSRTSTRKSSRSS